MAIASHLSVGSMVAPVSGRVRGRFRLCPLFACVMAMACTSAVWADIYRWTDKDGNVNYSDVAPLKEQHIKDVVVVTKSSRPAAQSAAPTQQELLARIQSLEQQMQAQRNGAPPPGVSPSPSYQAYYAPAAPSPPPYFQSPPVQPVTYNDGGYDSGTYDNTYSQPYMYSVAPLYVISFAKVHAARSAFAHRALGRGSFHNAPGRGRGGARPEGRR
jgi:Domain of unknown function (DUF4124)